MYLVVPIRLNFTFIGFWRGKKISINNCTAVCVPKSVGYLSIYGCRRCYDVYTSFIWILESFSFSYCVPRKRPNFSWIILSFKWCLLQHKYLKHKIFPSLTILFPHLKTWETTHFSRLMSSLMHTLSQEEFFWTLPRTFFCSNSLLFQITIQRISHCFCILMWQIFYSVV